MYPAYDQIVSEAARLRYRSAGQFSAPLTIRMPTGGGIFGGQTHSQSPEALFTHVAGLTTVIPSNPYDAKGLLLAAIFDNDPVIFLEPKRLYHGPFDGDPDAPRQTWASHPLGEVPDEYYEVPLGAARVVRPGTAVTVVAYGTMVHVAFAAAEATGVDAEILDLRTLVPIDLDTILASVEKTGRCVVVHEATRTSGFGAEVVALVQENAFYSLEVPIERVTGYDTPYPHAHEWDYFPSSARASARRFAVLPRRAKADRVVARGEVEVQGVDAEEDERRGVLVSPRVRWAVVCLRDPDVVESVEHALEGDAPFRAHERSARAEVCAASERHVLARVDAVDVELRRALELPRVAVARAQEQDQRAARRDRHAAELARSSRHPEAHLRRALEAECLLDEVGNAVAILPQLLLQLGFLGEDSQRRDEEPRRGALTAGEEDRGDAHDVDDLRQRAVGEPSVRHLREHVVTRLSASVLDVGGEGLFQKFEQGDCGRLTDLSGRDIRLDPLPERPTVLDGDTEQVGDDEHRERLRVLRDELARAPLHEAVDLLVRCPPHEPLVLLEPNRRQLTHHQPAVGRVLRRVEGDEVFVEGEDVAVLLDQRRNVVSVRSAGQRWERTCEGVARGERVGVSEHGVDLVVAGDEERAVVRLLPDRSVGPDGLVIGERVRKQRVVGEVVACCKVLLRHVLPPLCQRFTRDRCPRVPVG